MKSNFLRDFFPVFRHRPDLVYLDSAATAHKPTCVIDAISNFYARDYATVHRAVYQLCAKATDLYCSARETAREFLHAEHTDEIIFTKGTTDAINLVARAFPWKKGDAICLSPLEHHSNLIPWQMVAQEKGVDLQWISLHPDGTLQWPLPITKKTKLVAVSHVSNVTGMHLPIQQINQEAKRVGALLLIDGAQAAPHLPIDVQALGADFYAFSGHKCYGPTGIGILYGKRSSLSLLSPIQGGGDMVKEAFLNNSLYQEPPLCFEAGTPPIAEVVGLKAALEFLQTYYPVAYPQEQALYHFAREALASIPDITILGPKEPTSIITFKPGHLHPLDLAYWLDCRQIAVRTGHMCAQPFVRFLGADSVMRMSLGMYNQESDIVAFVETLQQALQMTSLHI